MRHDTRRTKADADVHDRFLALPRGGGRPRCHHMIDRWIVPVMDATPIMPHPDIP